MSYLDRVHTCRHWHPDYYRPFRVGNRTVGRIRHAFARRLADFPKVFQVTEAAVALDPALGDFDSRSAAVAEVVARLHGLGEIRHWRDEAYPVLERWGEAPLLKLERGAVPDFGVRGFGVHLNGLVCEQAESGLEGTAMWVGKRAMTKPTAPGKLDHIVGGGQPHGLGIRENLIKECDEEAAIPAELAARAHAAGLVSYRCERPEGLRDDVLFSFDLVLPAEFEPENRDGEVDFFELWPMERVLATIREGEAFKFNVALVIIDLAVRLGYITADEPDYQEIVHGLRLSGA